MTRLYLFNRCVGLHILLVLVFLFAFTSVAMAQDADLVIVKATDSTIVAADTDVQYDISVSNFSGQTSTPTNTLTDTIPMGMTFVSAIIPMDWDCTLPAVGSGGTITCTNESPFLDESSTLFVFVFHVNPNVPNDTVISNTATISHEGTDPNSGNSTSTKDVTVGEPPPPPPPPLAPHDVLISEFRLSGPGGNSDEYIEFYCNRDVNCNISGGSLRAYDPNIEGDFSITFPANTIIQARHYLLIADFSQYSLFDYALPDFDVNDPMIPDFFIDNQGIQIVGPDEGVVLDSVGFIGGGNELQYIEGTGLQPATSRPEDQYAYVRKRTPGPLQDTDNNAEDFVLVSVTGAGHPGIGMTLRPVLGAPGPQSTFSPLSYSNAQFPNSLVEPANDPHASPNRERVGSGDSGTISIRRSITNNTNTDFDYIAFRVIDIPTLNSPNPLGNRAQLRLITSPDAESFENSEPRTVNILGTILEYDAGCGCEPAQPNGGGLNSTVYANIDQIISPGETVDVQFLLNVVTAGEYRFYVYVEAFPATPECEECDAPGTAKQGRAARAARLTKTKASPRRMINLKRSAKATAPSGKKPKPNPMFPTKSHTTPVQLWIPRTVINLRSASTPARAKRQKRKVRRVRRRSSAELRAKAQAKYKADTPAAQ